MPKEQLGPTIRILLALAWVLAACGSDVSKEAVLIDPSTTPDRGKGVALLINVNHKDFENVDAGSLVNKATEIVGPADDPYACSQKLVEKNLSKFKPREADKQPKLQKPDGLNWIRMVVDNCWSEIKKQKPTPETAEVSTKQLDFQQVFETIYSYTKTAVDIVMYALICTPVAAVGFLGGFAVFKMIFGEKHDPNEQFWREVAIARANDAANDRLRAEEAPIKAAAKAKAEAERRAHEEWRKWREEEDAKKAAEARAQKEARAQEKRRAEQAQKERNDEYWANRQSSGTPPNEEPKQDEQWQEEPKKEQAYSSGPESGYEPPKSEQRDEPRSQRFGESGRIRSILSEALEIYQRDKAAGKNLTKIAHNIMRAIHPQHHSNSSPEDRSAHEEAFKVVNNALKAVERRTKTFEEFLDDESGWFKR